MQQVRPTREAIPFILPREKDTAANIVRTDLSSLLSEYTTTQRRYNDRLESLEREIASLKGQVHQGSSAPEEQELSRTFTIKRTPAIQPLSARVTTPSRIPLPITPRKLTNDDVYVVPSNNASPTLPISPPMIATRPLPMVPIIRSKSFQSDSSSTTSNTTIDDATILRSYKAHLEQILRKDVSQPYSDIKVPNYTCIEEVIKANEQLLTENDRLRSELNRLKAESILLIRSLRTGAGVEPNLGNERIMAERERQELATELARQVEENKRLRKSLLVQSEKFLALRQSTNASSPNQPVLHDHRRTPESAPQPSTNASRIVQSKSARQKLGNSRGFTRAKSFHHGSQDQS